MQGHVICSPEIQLLHGKVTAEHQLNVGQRLPKELNPSSSFSSASTTARLACALQRRNYSTCSWRLGLSSIKKPRRHVFACCNKAVQQPNQKLPKRRHFLSANLLGSLAHPRQRPSTNLPGSLLAVASAYASVFNSARLVGAIGPTKVTAALHTYVSCPLRSD